MLTALTQHSWQQQKKSFVVVNKSRHLLCGWAKLEKCTIMRAQARACACVRACGRACVQLCGICKCTELCDSLYCFSVYENICFSIKQACLLAIVSKFGGGVTILFFCSTKTRTWSRWNECLQTRKF
jgi:hypothetical protein